MQDERRERRGTEGEEGETEGEEGGNRGRGGGETEGEGWGKVSRAPMLLASGRPTLIQMEAGS